MAAKKKSLKKGIKADKSVKEKVVKKAKGSTPVDDEISIDWKIPVAFLAGVLVTALFFSLQGASANIDSSGDAVTNIATADAPITLFILNDDSCSVCDDTWIEQRVKMDFFNVTVNHVDISSAQGQSFLNSLSITSLPAAFFASDVEFAGNYSMYAEYGWILPVNNYYVLSIQGVKDLTRTPTSTPTVDLFVMSECPYGVPAQRAMIDAKELIPDFNLNFHYIGNVYTQTEWNALSSDYRAYYENYGMCELRSNDKYYCSLHGPEEVDNNIAQLCAINYYLNWTEFIKAHIDNGFDIVKASQQVGYDADLMIECVNSEIGWDLYENDVAIAESIGVGASPTYLFDNIIIGDANIMFDGPAGLLCTLHPELNGCENVGSIQMAESTGSC